MSKMNVLLPAAIKAATGSILSATLFMTGAMRAEAAPEDASSGTNATMQLAARIAGMDAGRSRDKSELVADYDKVYGRIGKLPARWPALVRRALVCQQVGDRDCVHSSMEAIDRIGGFNTFPLNHLFEVSRFGMSAETIRTRLRDAQSGLGDPANTAGGAGSEGRAPVVASTPAAQSSPEGAIAPVSMKVADPVAVIGNTVAKKAGSRTMLQRVSARLGKLGADDAAGFFLDALFVLVALSLLLAYFLFAAIRARKAERRERLQALQEIQRLENLAAEEKVRTDHELWTEQLKSEVALEAQKMYADELVRSTHQAAEKAIHSERLRAADAIALEQDRAAQMIQLEKSGAAEAIKAEQIKTEEAIKSAKHRADQAIDAYDQMAARELVFAHQHNDELQEALNAEKERHEALELKTEEALQAVEAFKLREKKLLDIIRAEQRVRESEARQAADRLKAAQQAAAALQASLVAARALKSDLERRADEAMRAAETRIAELRQRYESRMLPGASAMQAVAEPSGQIRPSESLPPVAAIVTLKDMQSG